jgi:sugar lactone lactonase YvrE
VVAARLALLGLFGCAEVAPTEPTTLFITDYRANAIVRYDGATGDLIDVFAAGAEQRVDRPASVQRGPDGNIYAAGFGRGDIVRYDEATGAMMDVFYWDTRLLEEPMELAFHGNELYVLGNDTKNLVVISGDGRAMRELGYPTMTGAQDFVIDGDRVFVSTQTHATLGSAVQVWDRAAGTLVRHFGTYDELAFASGLALHDGVLYVCDFERGRVLRFDPESGLSLGVLVDTNLELPVELGIAPGGALYVLDANGVQVFDRETGSFQRTLIPVDGEILQRPLGFTIVPQR